jgi:hypothetical protein
LFLLFPPFAGCFVLMKFARVSSVKLAIYIWGWWWNSLIMDPKLHHMGLGKIEDPPNPPPFFQVTKPIKVFDRPSI